MKYSFLIHNFYGVGGTNRAVLNLATALLEGGHQVEVASVFRRLDRTMFDVDERITVVPLVDTRPRRPDRSNPRHREPSTLIPETEEFHLHYSRLTDERIVRYLRSTDADVVVGTRPGLNLAVARHAPEHAVRVAQEHMTQDLIDDAVKAEIRRYYPRIDLAYTVTSADAAAFRAGNPVPGTRIEVLPNSSPPPGVPPADGRSRIVVAAGRLDPIKRYDRLITAFARAAVDCPGWTLRIYGDGEQRQALAALIRELGVYDQVQLMGRRDDMSTEWVKGAIAAVSSERESFGMTIVEAMRLGLPVVSTDCPVGPREIIDDGEDGLLVPSDDLDAYTGALLTLMRDDEVRARMGKVALANSARFDPAHLAAQFARDCEEVLTVRRAEPPRRPRAGRRVPRSGLTRSVLARGGELLREPDLVRTLADPVLRGIAGNDLARRASMGALVRLARVRRVRGTSTRLQQAIRRRVSAPTDGPIVDCLVLPDFGLQWSVDAATCAGEASVVLRNRDTREVVQVALAPAVDGLRHVGTLAAAALPEGRWNVYLMDGQGVRRRVRPQRLDSRFLAGGPDDGPAGGLSGVRAHVPYRTADGFLAVRSWVRAAHAEVRRIALDGEDVTIAFTWHGPGIPDGAVLRRRGDRPESLAVSTASATDGTMTMLVPLAPLTDLRLGRYEDWDIFLRQPGGLDEVRLGRFVDDVVDKKRTYNYPEIHLAQEVELDLVEEDPAPTLRVRPYYTIDSELSIVVIDRP
ncbi:Glycosyltransferase involved in cell wall bisynthesis [Micromonospora rhizosphaerae]|uniref:Glycosyltransferase involved in cell wall bisynthesis n=1 Tax=Micromonospora rhizosphaerae TaxID=568872 RepID=A0A1C6RYS6_9ACTN|nr:glycosyltransferase family 4 protein [Micromonospora rhizosphaerae]SCL22386.1 Glycosyltransferase involved in cell wall bisynthesis [Micromonospora rhizosphaerae]